MSFCSNCGNNLNPSDKFCSSCGHSLKEGQEDMSETQEHFSFEFSSNILLGGNLLTPDRILIDQTGVTYVKRNKYLIGKDRVHLSFQNISSVRIDRKLIDADIIIAGRGAVEIIAKDFSISDSKKIEQLIRSKL